MADIAEALFPPPLDGPAIITERDRRDLEELLAERIRRSKESLRLYEPSPTQQSFHQSDAAYRLAIGGNRGGKTLVTCVETARAITRSDPFGKWPQKGRFIVAGRDLLHISKVVYRKLFKAGPYKIIWDAALGRWRTFHPDLDDETKAVEAPPLVPLRFYDPRRISWEDKREEIPRTIRLRTDWEISFFSGKGDPPQGWDVDGCLFDEEIEHPMWFREMVPRLVDRRGRLMWSATPQAGTQQLYELSERAHELASEPSPRYAEWIYTIADNPFIGEMERHNFMRDMEDDEDEYQVRVLGNFAVRGMRVYPEFAPRGVHKVNSFPIPDNWCRYVAIDPGRQVAAALFIAVPPPHTDYHQPIVYDELYIKKCNAQIFAERMTAKLGNHWVQGWLIDHHEGGKHDASLGHTVEQQYSVALRKCKADALNGFKGFIWASDDVELGILAAKSKLHIHEGESQWLFMTENLRMFGKEIERYTDRRISRTGAIEDKPVKKNDHLMDCFRYLALHRLRYVRPTRKPRKELGWTNVLLAKRRKKSAEGDGWGGAIRLG